MRTVSIFAALATAKTTFAKGPFLKQISSTQWIIGNDLWNVTQGETYATNLQYQGSDAVSKAQGHYAGYGTLSLHSMLMDLADSTTDEESNLVYTSATIVSNSPDFIDVSFTSSLGDLHWVIYPDLTGAYQYFVNKALPDISIFRTLWRLDPDRFTYGFNTNKNEKLPNFSLYANAPEVQDETFLFPDGSYVTKYDFANYVRERDFVGVYGNETGSWYIHPTNEYQPGNHLSQTLTVSLTPEVSKRLRVLTESRYIANLQPETLCSSMSCKTHLISVWASRHLSL